MLTMILLTLMPLADLRWRTARVPLGYSALPAGTVAAGGAIATETTVASAAVGTAGAGTAIGAGTIIAVAGVTIAVIAVAGGIVYFIRKK